MVPLQSSTSSRIHLRILALLFVFASALPLTPVSAQQFESGFELSGMNAEVEPAQLWSLYDAWTSSTALRFASRAPSSTRSVGCPAARAAP